MKLDKKIELVSSREELLDSLNKYRKILSCDIFDYLKSLIELEFSVIRNYIYEEDREVLSELSIYRKVAIYNIYYRIVELFKRDIFKDFQFRIICNSHGKEGITIDVINRGFFIEVFNFSYAKLSGLYNPGIGYISLYSFLSQDNKKLCGTDKFKVDTSKLIHQKILEDYDLSDSDFELFESDCFRRTLVKKVTGLNIWDGTCYL